MVWAAEGVPGSVSLPKGKSCLIFQGCFNSSFFHTVILEPKSLHPSPRFARPHLAAAVLGAGGTFGLCHPERDGAGAGWQPGPRETSQGLDLALEGRRATPCPGPVLQWG